MSNAVIEKIASRARRAPGRVILPESDDPRVLRAAAEIGWAGYAHVVLLGEPEVVRAAAAEAYVDLRDIEIIDHLTDPARGEYVGQLHERRRARGLTLEAADEMLAHPVYYAGMMVGDGRADGMVAGSTCPTADTVRSALFGVGTRPGCKTVSACSVMCTMVPEVGVGGTLLFADTGVVPTPTIDQLADIVVSAAESCRVLLETEPVVAMLSFSTRGSARREEVRRVVQATELARRKLPGVEIDGELQLDAAVVPDVARRKAEDSPVAGRANTLIFPDLTSGNIGYKLVERLGRATALGPLLQGTARPVNDLSRGCSIHDIVLIAAITSVQAAEAGG